MDWCDHCEIVAGARLRTPPMSWPPIRVLALKHYPPYSWPGGSQVIDYDGRILAQASPGPGERIVVRRARRHQALRHERDVRRGHHNARRILRTEAYPVYRRPSLSTGERVMIPMRHRAFLRAKQSLD